MIATNARNKILSMLPPELRGPAATESLKQTAVVPTAPADWRDWLPTMFPSVFSVAFGQRHAEFWQWVEGIQLGVKPPAFFAVWGRGGAKTTSAEAAGVRLGAKRARKFCLYVRGTQDKSNESVQNIAAMLEAATFGRYYPDMAARKLGKYGNAKGWRVDTLRCGNGYSVVGLGLDAAVRGIKIEEFRPDLIILDDIDDIRDSPETVQKKIDIITTSILPAGSTDVVVIGIQNLIHHNSIFSRICDGRAEFLLNRVISGPYPAVEGLAYEKQNGRYVITAGTATWEGQPLDICEKQINEWGLISFLREAQHHVNIAQGDMFKSEYFQIVSAVPAEIVARVRYWDKAGAKPGQGDFTVGVLMAKGKNGLYYVENVVRGQWQASDRNVVIKQTAELDRLKYGRVQIYVEQPPGLAKESTDAVIKLLAGFPVHADRVTADKTERAEPYQAQCQAGNVRLLRGEWNQAYIDELCAFPLGKNDDQVDGSSGAFNRLAPIGGGWDDLDGMGNVEDFRSKWS